MQFLFNLVHFSHDATLNQFFILLFKLSTATSSKYRHRILIPPPTPQRAPLHRPHKGPFLRDIEWECKNQECVMQWPCDTSQLLFIYFLFILSLTLNFLLGWLSLLSLVFIFLYNNKYPGKSESCLDKRKDQGTKGEQVWDENTRLRS